MPSVLITGANGFIGSHLCDAFHERGYEVYALVRTTSNLKFLRHSQARLVYGDLKEIDSISLPELVDVIVHAAARVSDNASMEECRSDILEITMKLCEWALQHCRRLKRFVYISSALTLGYCSDHISEQNPGHSADYVPYNYMKKRTENVLRDTYAKRGLPLVIMRPGDVYGPRDRTSCELMLKAAERNQLIIVGRGDKTFGFCYPANLCQAVLAAVQTERAVGQAYTVTNSVLPTWRQFFSALREAVGKPQRIYIPVPLAIGVGLFMGVLKRLIPGFSPSLNYYRLRRITCQTTYDISKTIAELGYRPDDDFSAQVRATIEWYQNERKEPER